MQWNASGNAARGPDVKAACAAKGIMFTIWMTRPFTAAEARQACVESGAQGFVAEGEIPGSRPEAQNWPELVFELESLPIAKAVATNWSPFVDANGLPDATKAKALIQGGWSCLPYVYPAEHSGVTAERQAQYALHFTHEAVPAVLALGEGWYSTQPVFGCYSGEFGSFGLADFPTRGNYRNWSVWDAGSVL